MIIETEGDVIYLSGSMTRNHWLTLKHTCTMLLKQHSGGIVVHCEDIDRWTEEGLSTIAEAQWFSRHTDNRILIEYIPADIQRALELRREPRSESEESARTQPGGSSHLLQRLREQPR